MTGNFKAAWAKLEKSSPPPHFLRNVVHLDYKTFRDQVLNPTEAFVEKITTSLYSGDLIVLKNAISKDFLRSLKQRVFEYGNKIPEKSEQIIDGCSNFHYKSDENLKRPKDGYVALDHSYYFFRWNPDPLSVFSSIDPLWEMTKLLGGFSPKEYLKNIPTDQHIDKIQIIHYPSGVGGITVHSDPFSRQKAIFGLGMTEKGTDYQEGGFFMLNNKKEKVLLDSQIEFGSSVLLFPSMFHGVETIDSGKSVNWNSPDGRWFFTAYTIDSHVVENREKALSPNFWKKEAA